MGSCFNLVKMIGTIFRIFLGFLFCGTFVICQSTTTWENVLNLAEYNDEFGGLGFGIGFNTGTKSLISSNIIILSSIIIFFRGIRNTLCRENFHLKVQKIIKKSAIWKMKS